MRIRLYRGREDRELGGLCLLASTPDGDVRRRTVAYCANEPTVRRRSPTVAVRQSPTVSHATDRCRLVNMSVTDGQCTWTTDADGRWKSTTRHSVRRYVFVPTLSPPVISRPLTSTLPMLTFSGSSNSYLSLTGRSFERVRWQSSQKGNSMA